MCGNLQGAIVHASVGGGEVLRVDMPITPDGKRPMLRARRLLGVVHLRSDFLLHLPDSVESSNAASCSRSMGESFEIATAKSASELRRSMVMPWGPSSPPSGAAAFDIFASLVQALVQAAGGVGATLVVVSLTTPAPLPVTLFGPLKLKTIRSLMVSGFTDRHGNAAGGYCKDGQPTGEVGNFDQAVKPLVMLYGEELVDESSFV